jgi:hypothetical protein
VTQTLKDWNSGTFSSELIDNGPMKKINSAAPIEADRGYSPYIKINPLRVLRHEDIVGFQVLLRLSMI